MSLKFVVLAVGLALGLSLNLVAQNLPKEWVLEQDQHILFTGGYADDGLYDESIIREIYLEFEEANFWELLENNYDSHTDLAATLTMDGVAYPNVGVRFKGQTSYMMIQNSEKKSFNITMDFLDPGQDLMGYTTLNLNNCFEDESFLREFLYLHQIRRHIPAAKAAFVKLYINGESWGIYPNIQQLDSQFIEEWFLSNDGSRWRADAPGSGFGGGGMGGPQWGDGTAALNYLGADTTDYQEYYTLKGSDQIDPWDDLVTTCDVLENTPIGQLETELPSVLDIDKTLWYLASEILFADDDSYVYKGKMDYYLFWEELTGRMVPHEFDGNSVLHQQNINWGPFYHADNVNYPLLNRMMQVPAWRQRYLAHMRVLLADLINADEINGLITSFGDFIDAEVQADTKKLYTYNAFNSEQTTLMNYLNTRRIAIGNNAEVNLQGPVISAAEYSVNGNVWQAPSSLESVWVNASVTSVVGIERVNLYYSDQLAGNFLLLEMLDDGQHEDGSAGDGVYGIQIPGFVAGTGVRFYIEAIGADIPGTRSYDPPGAEHDVYFYIVEADVVDNSPVVINEILAQNTSGQTDESGQSEDWIELYNNSDQLVDLTGYYLSDDPLNLDKWEIPAGTAIMPGEYLVIWADEDALQGTYHANFKLSASGEYVLFLDPNLGILDQIQFGQQVANQGFARVPNGTGDFEIQNPTFGYNNDLANDVADFNADNWIIYPVPANDYLFVTADQPSTSMHCTVYDFAGRAIWSSTENGNFSIDVSAWSAGFYVLNNGISSKQFVITR
jgi:hypothetical protein